MVKSNRIRAEILECNVVLAERFHSSKNQIQIKLNLLTWSNCMWLKKRELLKIQATYLLLFCLPRDLCIFKHLSLIFKSSLVHRHDVLTTMVEKTHSHWMGNGIIRKNITKRLENSSRNLCAYNGEYTTTLSQLYCVFIKFLPTLIQCTGYEIVQQEKLFYYLSTRIHNHICERVGLIFRVWCACHRAVYHGDADAVFFWCKISLTNIFICLMR